MNEDETLSSGWLGSYLKGDVSFAELMTSAKPINPTNLNPQSDSDDSDDDAPSTSTCTKSGKKKQVSESARKELLSGRTQNLLIDYFDAVGEAMGDEQEDDVDLDDSDQPSSDYDDPNDDDYRPKAKKSAKMPTAQKTKKRTPERKRGQQQPNVSMRERRDRNLAQFDFDQSEAVVFGLPGDVQQSDDIEWTKPHGGRKLPFELEALLGEANMVFAKGRHQEAIQMVHEVIRQKPNAHTAYEMLAVMYEDLKEEQEHLQYSLMAAYLNYKTDSEEWTRLAELCKKQNMIKQALACFSRAMAVEPDNWNHYENKLQLLADVQGSDKAMLDTYRKATVGLKDSKDKDFYLNLVSNTVQKFLDVDDIDTAIKCLAPVVDKLHAKDVSKPVDSQYLLLYSTLLCEIQCFYMAAVTILVNGVVKMKVDDEIVNDDLQEEILAEYENKKVTYEWPTNAEPIFKARLAVAWIGLHRPYLCKSIVDELLYGDMLHNGDALLACVAALLSEENFEHAEHILHKLISSNSYEKDAEVWLQYAECLSSLCKHELACEAFARVVELAPSHVEARLCLSTLQQQLGRSSQALETLMDEQEEETQWPADERLLFHKCQLLHAHKEHTQFLKGSRRLLAPYFYEFYNEYSHGPPRGRPRTGIFVSVRNVVFEIVRGSNLEGLVKSLGPQQAAKDMGLSPKDIHDLCLQNAEILFESKRFYDMILFCAYAATCSILNRNELWKPFERLLLLACLRARLAAKCAFAIIRYGYARQLDDEHTRAWNIIALVLMMQQDVRYHRYLLRAAAKQPNSRSLSLLNGNCSLISGTYPHAIAEFVSGLERYPADPLLNLLTSVSFLAVACKKFILKRHQVLVEGLAFLSRYEQARGKCQETYYNFGRALHQANILPGAVHFYRKALQAQPVIDTSSFDLKAHAAHNLALIYKNCGQTAMAKQLLHTYCSV